MRCKFCNRELNKANALAIHEKYCKLNPHKQDPLQCRYCGKECRNDNSLRNHERFCKLNPNQEESGLMKYNKERESTWNKGLTEQTDERVAKYCRTRRAHLLDGSVKIVGHPHTEETKQKLRESALRNKLGGFHFRRGINYGDVKLDSSYEVAVAKSLDENGVKWERCERFKYHDMNNRLHYYTPDFYLPDYNVYLDPKNDFLINNINPNLGFSDKEKIEWVVNQNNVKVLILDKDHLTWDNILKLLL